MLLISILSAVVQVAVVLAVGFIVFLLAGRKKSSFTAFLGLTPSPLRPVILGVGIGIAAVLIMLSVPGFAALAKGPGTVTGDALRQGITQGVIGGLIVTAIFKTALAEELLFRGIIGKRLIGWLGFRTGNAIQAALFGALHLLLALTPDATAAMVAAIVAFSTFIGWINGWLNERFAGGSILPGWACHAAANLGSYLSIAYGIF